MALWRLTREDFSWTLTRKATCYVYIFCQFLLCLVFVGLLVVGRGREEEEKYKGCLIGKGRYFHWMFASCYHLAANKSLSALNHLTYRLQCTGAFLTHILPTSPSECQCCFRRAAWKIFAMTPPVFYFPYFGVWKNPMVQTIKRDKVKHAAFSVLSLTWPSAKYIFSSSHSF